MLYRHILRPLLYRMDPEKAHHLAFGALRRTAAIPGGKGMLRLALSPKADPALTTRVWDLELPSPVGLAAGFDKDAIGFEALGAAGFGFVEVGTLTAHAQPGNPKPRLFRLPKDRALLNRMGFNNGGSKAAEPRLAAPRQTIVGVNIGKSKITPAEEAADDYALSAARLAPHADYLVVNVSSPNTPGLRDLQAVESLEPILRTVRETCEQAVPNRRVPLLVKIAPDLADEDIDAVAQLATALELEGVIANNTTISRQGLRTDPGEVRALGNGGLSGAPLKARSLQVLERLRAKLGPETVLVAVGGIEDADDAWVRIRAGATLVQVYSSYIYEGPTLPKELATGLAKRARNGGFSRIQDAVGLPGATPGVRDGVAHSRDIG